MRKLNALLIGSARVNIIFATRLRVDIASLTRFWVYAFCLKAFCIEHFVDLRRRFAIERCDQQKDHATRQLMLNGKRQRFPLCVGLCNEDGNVLSDQILKTSIISTKFSGPPNPSNCLSLTRHVNQLLSERSILTGVNDTPSRLVSSRLITTRHPGLSKVSMVIPSLCSQSPLHWEKNHFCIHSKMFILGVPGRNLIWTRRPYTTRS
jgi:hypothetical protein